MGELKTTFDSGDYKEFYSLSVGEQEFAVGVHNEGRGADVMARELIDSDLSDFENLLEAAEAELQIDIENAAGSVMIAANKLLGDPAMKEAMSGINFYDPTYQDIDAINEGMERVIDVLDRADSDIEIFEAKTNLEQAQQELQEVIETSEAFAVLDSVHDTLEKMGLPAADIAQAFTISENNNPSFTHNYEPAAPGLE